MEFKRTTNSRHGQRRIVVPQRRGAPPTPFSLPVNKPVSGRSLFGPDEPLINDEELEDVSFRDILKAWFRQSIKHSPLETKQKQVEQFKNEKLKTMKNDLKWALMADLDEPVKPRPKPQVQQQPPHRPAPRPVHGGISGMQSIATPHARRSSATSHRPQLQQATTADTGKTIDINISLGSLPKVPWHKLKAPLAVAANYVRTRSKKQLVFAGSTLLAVAVILTIVQLHSSGSSSATSSTIAGVQNDTHPTYNTILPSGKSASDVGDFHRVSPPGSNPVYAYADDFRGTHINVSEQPIPDGWKSNIQSNVEKLAKDYSATNKITINGTLVYVGTSYQGPQSIIFTKNNLLVLIKSSSTRNENDWAWYADNLR